MIPRDTEERFGPPLIAAACAYEVVAIASRGRIPTISRGVWWLYERRAGRALLWMAAGAANAHFLREPCRHDIVIDN